MPPDAARDNADVAALARVAGNPEDLETLDVYCATGSLRRAADLLHLHHSSVARRLEQIGKALGIELGDLLHLHHSSVARRLDHIGKAVGIELGEPAGLVRARLALTAWRLLDG